MAYIATKPETKTAWKRCEVAERKEERKRIKEEREAREEAKWVAKAKAKKEKEEKDRQDREKQDVEKARERGEKEKEKQEKEEARAREKKERAEKKSSKQLKTPKHAKKAPTEGGPGSCLGTANCRDLGDSDDEILKLDPDLADAIDIKPLILDGPAVEWTYEEDEKVMTWITDEA